jgi:hypothetical protein
MGMKDVLGRDISPGFYVAYTDNVGDMCVGKVIALLHGGSFVSLRRIDDQSRSQGLIASKKCVVVDYDYIPRDWLA